MGFFSEGPEECTECTPGRWKEGAVLGLFGVPSLVLAHQPPQAVSSFRLHRLPGPRLQLRLSAFGGDALGAQAPKTQGGGSMRPASQGFECGFRFWWSHPWISTILRRQVPRKNQPGEEQLESAKISILFKHRIHGYLQKPIAYSQFIPGVSWFEKRMIPEHNGAGPEDPQSCAPLATHRRQPQRRSNFHRGASTG